MSKKSVSGPQRLIGPARVSFVTIFEPKSYKGGDPKYSIRVMFKKDNEFEKQQLMILYNDAKKALEDHWSDPDKRPAIDLIGNWDSPIKDGDKAKNKKGHLYVKTQPEVAGHWFIMATMTPSATRPKVTIANRVAGDPVGPGDIYSGCYCKVNVNVYTYTTGSEGVTFGLNGVRKWEDAEPLTNAAPLSESALFDDNEPEYVAKDDPFKEKGNPFDAPANPLDEDTPFN